VVNGNLILEPTLLGNGDTIQICDVVLSVVLRPSHELKGDAVGV
jgi:hypothetical protein